MLSLFFFNDTATTEIYTLSLHDALPIFTVAMREVVFHAPVFVGDLVSFYTETVKLGRTSITVRVVVEVERARDRKSTRLNSSHGYISYAVFCLKKKKKQINNK